MRPSHLVVSGLLLACSVKAAASAFVDASRFTAVSVNAPLYDTNLSDSNGCDPAGCQGSLTRDGDSTSLGSRWSCKPALGDAGSLCAITYTLSDAMQVFGLNIAMYKGDQRTRSMDIYVDGVKTETWTSSGTTSSFENVKLGFSFTSSTSSYETAHPGVTVEETIELRGLVEEDEWISILEVEIQVEGEETVDEGVVEAGAVGTVVASADLYDTNLSSSNGCDPAGCTAALSRDGDLSQSSRWSCVPKLGGPCTISYDLGGVYELSELRLALYRGDTRQRTVEVYVDGAAVTTWTSSGTTLDFESIALSGTSGEVVEVRGVLENSEWLSIVEAEIMVFSDDATTPPTSPTPDVTPSPSIVPPQPVAPSPEGVLQPVGLLPLGYGAGSDLDVYYVKDGDFSTSWSCTGDERDADDSAIVFDCEIFFDLFHYRHLKEVHIALPDGADRAVSMRITGRTGSWSDLEFLTSSGTVDGFVTSSGSTTELEAYGFDYFTDIVAISGVFTSSLETISISEVEFVEEVFADEIPVVGFSTPYNLGDGGGSATDAFTWISDSAEALGMSLGFSLSNYAMVTAIELEFPVGDTYKFDVELYNDAVDHPSEDLVSTIEGFESEDMEGWQTFETPLSDYATSISIVMRGTGSGTPGFNLLNARIIGTVIDNPTDTYYVGSTRVEDWDSDRYPDFVAEGTGDQRAIMEAICTVKKASFNGVDCDADGDSAATGTVRVPMGDYFVDGNVFMKSGVHLRGMFSSDDQPGITEIFLEEGAAGKTGVDAFLVADGISDAIVSDVWVRGLYDPEMDASTTAVSGLGTTGISVSSSRNISCLGVEATNFDGDGIVVSGSDIVNIDAGDYDDDLGPLDIRDNRGTGLVVDGSDAIYVRRHDLEGNGIAGIHLMGSNNVTFVGPLGYDSGLTGQYFIGREEGPQPLDVKIESSSLVTFNNVLVRSMNDPVMTVSMDSSGVSFNSCSFTTPEGTCVIQAEDTSVVTVTTTSTPELVLDEGSNCYVKV